MRLKKLLINFIIENFIDSAYCIGYRITNRDFGMKIFQGLWC